MDDDHEGNVDWGMAVSAALNALFYVQLARCRECAVLCAAWLRMGRFSRNLRYLFDSPWGYCSMRRVIAAIREPRHNRGFCMRR